MIQTKFIRLFAGLSNPELKSFRKFVDSPFFEVRPSTKQLFYYLKKTHAHWHPIYAKWQAEREASKKTDLEAQLLKYLGKEVVMKKLFPGQPENDARIRRIISQLKRHLMDFILQVAPKPEEARYHQNLAVLRYHLQKGEYGLFEAKLAEVQKDQGQIQFQDHAFFYYSFQVEELLNDYYVRAGIRKYTFSLMLEYLDTFFVLYKLRMFCSIISLQKQFDQPFRVNMMAEILEFIQHNDHLQQPLIKIYHEILQMETNADGHPHYRAVLDQVREYKPSIHPREVRQIYGFIYNFLQREHRKAGVNMTREMFHLFQEMYTDGTIYSDGLLTTTWFRICIQIACQAGEYEWAEDFIYAHEERIAGEDSGEVFDFGLLTVLFHRGAFREVIKRIDQLRLVHLQYQIKRRLLKIKCFYELANSEEFFNQLENLRKSIAAHKGKLSDKSVELYSRFRLFAEKLGHFRFGLQEVPLGYVDSLENLPCAEQEWLLKKSRELSEGGQAPF